MFIDIRVSQNTHDLWLPLRLRLFLSIFENVVYFSYWLSFADPSEFIFNPDFTQSSCAIIFLKYIRQILKQFSELRWTVWQQSKSLDFKREFNFLSIFWADFHSVQCSVVRFCAYAFCYFLICTKSEKFIEHSRIVSTYFEWNFNINWLFAFNAKK